MCTRIKVFISRLNIFTMYGRKFIRRDNYGVKTGMPSRNVHIKLENVKNHENGAILTSVFLNRLYNTMYGLGQFMLYMYKARNQGTAITIFKTINTVVYPIRRGHFKMADAPIQKGYTSCLQ